MSIAMNGRQVPEFHGGDRLRKARELAGLSMGTLAERVGVHRDSITRAESAERPKGPMIAAYALATGVDIEWLKTGKYTPRDLNPEPTD